MAASHLARRLRLRPPFPPGEAAAAHPRRAGDPGHRGLPAAGDPPGGGGDPRRRLGRGDEGAARAAPAQDPGEEGGAGPPHPLRDHPRVPGVLRAEGPGLAAHAARVPRALRGAPGHRREGGARRGPEPPGARGRAGRPEPPGRAGEGARGGGCRARGAGAGHRPRRRPAPARVKSVLDPEAAARKAAGRGPRERATPEVPRRGRDRLPPQGRGDRRRRTRLGERQGRDRDGHRVDPGTDLVVVDGKPVEVQGRDRYILLYKPPGCVTTLSDPAGPADGGPVPGRREGAGLPGGAARLGCRGSAPLHHRR